MTILNLFMALNEYFITFLAILKGKIVYRKVCQAKIEELYQGAMCMRFRRLFLVAF